MSAPVMLTNGTWFYIENKVGALKVHQSRGATTWPRCQLIRPAPDPKFVLYNELFR
jgi:hypothetical protein